MMQPGARNAHAKTFLDIVGVHPHSWASNLISTIFFEAILEGRHPLALKLENCDITSYVRRLDPEE
jgi:hypothetical protein